jgi:lipopolysaccharide export system protein LptA
MKYSPFSTFFTCLLVVLGSTMVGVASAEKADRTKPMNVEADSLRYDDLQQTSVFTGRVVLTKGTIIIRGGQLNVRQDPEGYQFGVVTAEPGKLAFFRQKREGLDEYIEGEGEVIEYNGRADTVKFIKKAQLRRYRSSALNDEMTGGVILYDNATDAFTIDDGGVKGQPNQAGVPAGRIRAMLTPNPDGAAAKSGTSVTPPASPATLRSSTTLGGEKK